jgi:ADP-ribosylglycohydrolase
MAGDSSRTTHQTPAAIDACRYFAGLIIGALSGLPKDDLLSPRYSPVDGLWDREPLHPAVDVVAGGSFRLKRPPAIRGTGYVVESLEAALWAFHTTDDFRTGALAAVNLGDDADTTGAVFGQIAGAYYGHYALPSLWKEQVVMRSEIEALTERLLLLARKPRAS